MHSKEVESAASWPALAFFALLVSSVLLVSCATSPLVLSAVGPEQPIPHTRGGTGYLVVHTDTEERRIDKGVPYYLHTGYVINPTSGKESKWVANHVGDMDQMPEQVSLPAGAYEVVARSTSYGRVHVPVVIEASRTTEVRLDRSGHRNPQFLRGPNTNLVRLPDGEIVGWQAVQPRAK